MTNTATVSLTTAFIDLSTFDEIESWLYGGRSVNKFRKVIRKSAWFTVIAAQLNKCGTTGDFDQEVQAMFSRAGDYIRDVWLRVELPQIETNAGFQARWTRNIGHNIIDEAYLQFNDLVVNKITNYQMDFLRGFMLSASKRSGYDSMIGNVNRLANPYATVDPEDYKTNGPISLPRYAMNIPLPFWFTRSPSDAIIQAACPFNDIKLTVKFRPWQDLLIVDELLPSNTTTGYSTRPVPSPNWDTVLRNSTVRLQACQVWAHYAVIPNGDREKIGEEADIDVMIEQVQTIPATSFAPSTNQQRGIDLRFAHSIRAIFFAMRNTTYRNEWSNYSTHATKGFGSGRNHYNGIIFGDSDPDAVDPINRAVLTYENVDRVNMFADYYSMVAPYYTACSIPDSVGYHVLPYCNRLDCNQPDGSTNFARLASVTLNIEASDTAVATNSNTTGIRSTFDIIITACSNTILRFSSGSAGFPVV
jgi:hypothetical protein